MTDAATLEAPATPPISTAEDKVLPAVTYGLYIAGLTVTGGLTALIGLIIAYVSKDSAGPVMASHYTYLIRTFWLGLAAFVVTGLGLAIGIPLSFVLIGIPLVIVAGIAMSLAWVWLLARCIVGMVHVLKGEAHPRPLAYLI